MTAIHGAGILVLAKLREQGIVFMPRNSGLWFTYRAGMSPALTQHVRLAPNEGQTLTTDVLDTLYDERVASVEMEFAAIRGHSNVIQEAAQTLIDQVTTYGDTLTDCAQHLRD